MESPKKLEARADELLEWMLENTRSTEFIKKANERNEILAQINSYTSPRCKQLADTNFSLPINFNLNSLVS